MQISDTADVDDDPSVQLAIASMRSPSRPRHGDKTTAAALKQALSKMLRTEVGDSTALQALRFHPQENVNVIGIVTSLPSEPAEPKRTRGRARGASIEFRITDASIAPANVAGVHIFRPHRESLPVVHPGDAVVLRQFAVAPVKGHGFGLRAGEGSSWAVFEREREDGLPQIRGPPVEVSDDEVKYVSVLKEWYGLLDEKAADKLAKANKKAAEA
jgi:hypothetical protein